MRYAMIMAGGSGTRLWPVSRGERPKQLAPLIDGRSMLAIAVDRAAGLVPEERRYICTGEAHRAAIREALPSFTDDRILGEPTGRDTVNAVGFTAAALAKQDPEAVFAVLTADHLIEPEERFRECVDLGFRLVEDDPTRLVTFSIAPTHPATGFGYVERGEPIAIGGGENRAFVVKQYVEKPDLERAKEYIAAGTFGWNSGMFVWRASTALEAIRKFKPDSYDGLMTIAEAWGTSKQASVLNDVYPTLPKQSVDYAIMEPASGSDDFEVATVVADVQWRDVGSWPSFAETLSGDSSGNRIDAADGDVTTLDCGETLVVNKQPGHHVAVLGLEGFVVVHTERATLVMPAEQAERLKALHGMLPEDIR